MAGRRQPVPEQYAAVYEGYAAALRRARNLDPDTRRAYDSRVRGYLAWLATAGLDGERPLADPHDRDFAARDYQAHLKAVRKLRPRTVLAHLTALDHFYSHLGLGPVLVRRDPPPRRAPRGLGAREQKRYLRAAERRLLARDRAIARLLFYTGLRVGELAALDTEDVALSARKGLVIVRSGKGGKTREVPLVDPSARAALGEWLAERRTWPGAGTSALFLNRRGGRLSTRSVDLLVGALALDADLVDDRGKPAISAHTIRHTFGTNLIRAGTDIVLVAELMGHNDLETTRLYTLPTQADVETALATLPADQ